jgi:hypothetical protein
MASIGMIISTSGLYNTTQTSAATKTETTAATTTAQDDTVKLSAAAEAKMLYKQGQGVSTIAASLGTDAKTVDSYLGLTLEKAIEKTLETTLSAKA